MLNMEIVGACIKCNFDTPIAVQELREQIEEATGLVHNQYYILYNGRLVQDNDICSNNHAVVVPRLLGGKGGFGSMLRAIGAQIEKTTNREACRDLSGRRLRDINEEKRLKAWIEKQTKREKELVERKKKKLEKLCAEPKHEFKDQRYDQERAELTERVGDAVEEGFKAAGTSGIKRKREETNKSNKRKTMLYLDIDIDSDEFDDSDDNDMDEALPEEIKTKEQISNESGHSSDDAEKVNENECSKSKSLIDNQISDKTSSNDSLNTKCIVDSV
ncbi:replication stress response regulator SDE2 [Pogonomyrmex barbatus]|uniref:Replication stress response regulator SDE2 n=1 Tax=Pogonomyrmex barbatus TaxID=144034 RepID=A0A6I9WS35_9HYME|nr:replication stress response regulator SDE2 [Pogonomyrmex barbatus]